MILSKTQVTVVGAGYVGMSLATLLAKDNCVTIFDIDLSKVNKINSGRATVSDPQIESALATKRLDLKATQDKKSAYQKAEFIIIAVPTDYDENRGHFNTRAVDSVVKDILGLNSDALIVIKSTVPVGHTSKLQDMFFTDRIVFCPEFLREGNALTDNLFPSRIIMGSKISVARKFAKMLQDAAKKNNVPILLMKSSEAEAVKLFANTYLALRVSFFNELDSYALAKDLDTRNILQGVCLDERIGSGYNNPSFGYGGYCLPKDTKQLLSNYQTIPQNLMSAVVSSNETRKEFISNKILSLKPGVAGFYRLIMKEGSDNFRESAILGIIEKVKEKGIVVIIYEPNLEEGVFEGSDVIGDLNIFKTKADLIIANRQSSELKDCQHKVFSRDLFNEH